MAQTSVTDTLERAREETLALIAAVGDQDLEAVHSPLMSPLVWDLGHIAAFEDLWLCHRHGGQPLLRPDLAETYDAFETPRSRRGGLPYLRRADAEAYLAAVRERVRELTPCDLHQLVARHELQHVETMLQTLNLARLDGYEPPGVLAPPPGPGELSGLELIDVPGATFPLGAGPDGFAYDNERPCRIVEVDAFRIGRVAVTNGDWREFTDDGGYARREWWSPAGWDWLQAERVRGPLNWVDDATEWSLSGGTACLDPARPVVHVSWFEADAFARARGLRLPSEAEWELAATWDHAAAAKLDRPWGEEPPSADRAGLREGRHFEPAPAGAFPDGAAPCGALGMIGDVWEWTAGGFDGYPGFVAEPYREYSEVFFGGDYRVLRGGSFATSATVVTPTFRNWDHPQRRQIFSGLRLAGDA